MSTTAGQLLLVVAVVFAVNLLPAFGPPNALLVVFFGLNGNLDPVPLVVCAAVASGAGRYVLAAATRRAGGHLGPRRTTNLRAAGDHLTGRRGRKFATIGVFLVSPLPSAQLFEAAGLLGLRLFPLTAAHVAGRTVSFSLYLSAAEVAERSLGETLTASFTTPYGIAVQIVLLVGVVMLARVDWTGYLPVTTAHPAQTHRAGEHRWPYPPPSSSPRSPAKKSSEK
ncbi:hypothetical protein IU469_30335 [Nocardia puris]|uniref:hypothetical protein n=1 Tax=Nocardia puris TaxID=208602 RepID=UPI001894DFBD|nr:hypothetical protein [Nocardia puris]MBF6215401.1 hypothetical protein [Nocardia puris]MBF6369979.1 hypothetical protein [Nocardia puris]